MIYFLMKTLVVLYIFSICSSFCAPVCPDTHWLNLFKRAKESSCVEELKTHFSDCATTNSSSIGDFSHGVCGTDNDCVNPCVTAVKDGVVTAADAAKGMICDGPEAAFRSCNQTLFRSTPTPEPSTEASSQTTLNWLLENTTKALTSTKETVTNISKSFVDSAGETVSDPMSTLATYVNGSNGDPGNYSGYSNDTSILNARNSSNYSAFDNSSVDSTKVPITSAHDFLKATVGATFASTAKATTTAAAGTSATTTALATAGGIFGGLAGLYVFDRVQAKCRGAEPVSHQAAWYVKNKLCGLASNSEDKKMLFSDLEGGKGDDLTAVVTEGEKDEYL